MGAFAFLEGGGEMGGRMAAYDWAATPLGPIEIWPQSLKTATGLLLRSQAPIVMLWGEDGIMIYNDAYSVFAGQRHPQLLGSKVREGWLEVADFNDNIMKVGLAGGTLSYKDQELMLNRRGTLEKAWLDLEYSPVLDESGRPAGVIALVFETTERFLAEARVQSERDRLWQMFEQAPGFICTMRGPEHVYEFVNAAHRRLFGSGDWIGKPLRQAFPDIEGQGFYELMDRVYQTGERYVANAVSVRFASSRGEAPTDRLLDFVYEPMLDEAGRVSGIFCEGYDVTDRLYAEQALRRSESRLRALVNASANATYQMNADWTEMRLLDGTGSLATTPMPTAAWGDDHIHPDDREQVRQVVQRTIAAKTMFELEHRVKLDDGSWGWTLSRAVPLLDDQGEITEWFGAASDVTERRAAQAALQESEARLRLALDVAAMGTMIWHVEEDRTEADQQMLALFGLAPAGGRGPATMLRDLIHPDDLERHLAGVARACDPSGPGLLREDIRVLQPEGWLRWLAINGQVEFGGEPRRALRMVAAGIDITQRKAIEAALRTSEARLEERVAAALAERRLLADIVEGTDAFVQVADMDFRWLAINKASADEFERIFGRRPKVGDNMLDLLHDMPQHREAVHAVWRRALNGEAFVGVQAFGDPGHDQRTYEMRFDVLRNAEGEQIGAYQFVYDITERLREQARLTEAETALHQAQKMETVGQLTGGVAHDFNNLLTPIVGALDVLRKKVAGDERAERLTAGAQQAADRARTLVQRLLAFSRRQHLTPQAVDVGALIEGMTDLVSRSLGPRIRLTLAIDPGLPPAHVDPNQLELALLNLAVNGRDAMADEGELTFSAQALDGDVEGRLPPGRYLRISVTDTGAGMSEETLKRAVEPFFTTKGVGRGTGLGLSSVQGLTEQSGGAFELTSQLGQGSTASLWLPVSNEAPAPAPVRAEAEAMAASGARVLLVDDESMVRAGVADMLVQAGYHVTEAASGGQALDLLNSGLTVDIVVTDYAMPGMTGAQLGLSLAQLRPGLPVLMITGYASLGDKEAEDLPRLAKPFRQEELAAAVAGLLEAR